MNRIHAALDTMDAKKWNLKVRPTAPPKPRGPVACCRSPIHVSVIEEQGERTNNNPELTVTQAPLDVGFVVSGPKVS